MPAETFHGPDFTTLLARAQALIGEDAVVLSARRVSSDPESGFELVAADPASAPRPRRVAPPSSPGPVVARPMPAFALEQAGQGGPPVVIALVGPTGAGKTTTIAKLANHPQAFGGDTVGLLCLDTYRVGAVEQSRIYAELSRVPLEVVYEPDEIGPALRRLRGCRVILVDTPGRGPRAKGDVATARAMLRDVAPLETHLAIPAGLQPRLARRIVADYREWGVTHLLPTKLDEFPEDTTLFELAGSCGLPMRWVTDGQEVPADLHPARSGPLPRPAGAATRDGVAAGAV